MSVRSSFSSRAPVQPIVTGTAFYGTGIDQILLPGSGTNQFNFGLGRSDMVQLVNRYNQTWAGKPGPNPVQIFPRITLPQHFDMGARPVGAGIPAAAPRNARQEQDHQQ